LTGPVDVAVVVFIGDEVSAAGFRLAGAEVLVPEPDDVEDSFLALRSETDLVLLTADAAGRIGKAHLKGALRAGRPLIAIVPDCRNRVAPPDLEHDLRRILGLEL